MSRPEVVCLGETMALVAPDPPRPLASAEHLVLGHAGAESNVAVALAALGTATAWCSRLGDDALGHRVLGAIGGAGVDTTLVRLDATRPTGVMFKDVRPAGTSVLYYRRGSAASAMDASDVARALAASPRLLHLTGITPALSPSCAAATEAALVTARTLGTRISFDVNHRPALWSDRASAAERLQEIARRCDIVFVGLDEAAALWATATPAEIRALLPEPDVLVVKDGGRGASAITADRCVEVAALPVEVLEPVGAGDAFAAGWLHAALTGRSLESALRLGHLVAAGSLRSATDQAPIPIGLLDGQSREDAPWPPPGPQPTPSPTSPSREPA